MTKKDIRLNRSSLCRTDQLVVLFIISLALLLAPAVLSAEEKDTAGFCRALDRETAATILQVNGSDLIVTDRPVLVSPEDRKNKLYKGFPISCGYRSSKNFFQASVIQSMSSVKKNRPSGNLQP